MRIENNMYQHDITHCFQNFKTGCKIIYSKQQETKGTRIPGYETAGLVKTDQGFGSQPLLTVKFIEVNEIKNKEKEVLNGKITVLIPFTNSEKAII